MNKTVLFCDDEPNILRPTEYALQRDGLNVICTVDGEEAWEKFLTLRPDLLVTDWQMPRLDGLQLVERVRGHSDRCNLPVIMVSARSEELQRSERAQRLQLAAVIAKPFSPRELNRCIEQIIEVGAQTVTQRDTNRFQNMRPNHFKGNLDEFGL